MNAITSQLNTMFPELSLSVDENTGELNRNEEQVRRSADAALELAKASAAQGKNDRNIRKTCRCRHSKIRSGTKPCRH